MQKDDAQTKPRFAISPSTWVSLGFEPRIANGSRIRYAVSHFMHENRETSKSAECGLEREVGELELEK